MVAGKTGRSRQGLVEGAETRHVPVVTNGEAMFMRVLGGLGGVALVERDLFGIWKIIPAKRDLHTRTGAEAFATAFD